MTTLALAVLAPDLSDPDELLKCVRSHVHERLGSLEADIRAAPLAPFPGLLYCFSTIDMLAALAGGDAGAKAPTTRLSAEYMRDYMAYSDEQIRLLQGQFRHKLVHLAQPMPIVRDGDKLVAWRISCDANNGHLSLSPLPQGVPPAVYGPLSGPQWRCHYTHFFHVSVPRLVGEIRESATDYLQSLKRKPDLQAKARKALGEIYEP